MGNSNSWDKIFKEHGKYFTRIHDDLPKVVRLFKRRNFKRILDLGCGSGRHTVYLTKHDFSVYGIDSSKEGIKVAKNWLREKGLKANLSISSIYKKLPWRDNFFDAVVCTSVLQHEKIKSIKRSIREIERVLKSKGMLFLTVPRRKPKQVKFREIEPNTCLLLEGEEKGVLHYFYNRKLLKKDFKNFSIKKIWIDCWGYYALLGELKERWVIRN